MTFTPPPGLGSFTFPAPYGVRGIRLTNASNAPNGCEPRMYSYWTVINNHRGADHLYVVVGRVGARPLLLMVNKTDLRVQTVGEIPIDGTAEGWYFSDTKPYDLYMIQGNRLARYHILTGAVETVFTLDRQHGAWMKQAHSSSDDRVHSATVQDNDYRPIGYVVFNGQTQRFFPADGVPDECQIDKSGRYFVIQESNNNRFVDLGHPSQPLTRNISNEEGAVAHCDVGDKFVIGEDDQHEPGALVKWRLDVWGQREVIWQAPDWGPGMGHVADRGDLALLSSNWSDEIIALSIARRHPERPIAPGMMARSPGMTGDELYDRQLRACIDPLGEWCCWTSNINAPRGRFDAFMAYVGSSQPALPPLVDLPPPIKPGGRVKVLTIFAVPEDARVTLRHDSGSEFVGVPETADGRPAHLLSIDDALPEGHGAQLTIEWKDGRRLEQHGFLYLKRGAKAEFVGDVFYKPKSF